MRNLLLGLIGIIAVFVVAIASGVVVAHSIPHDLETLSEEQARSAAVLASMHFDHPLQRIATIKYQIVERHGRVYAVGRGLWGLESGCTGIKMVEAGGELHAKGAGGSCNVIF